jgi:hypothetical protein
MKRHFIALLCCVFVAGCSDGATRAAYQIESETASFQKSRDARHTIVHQPVRQWDNGCAGAYKLQMDKVGALIIWCYDSDGKTTNSHSTSYHARFVDTPQTWIVEKKSGESTAIELEKTSGKPRVTNVR